MHNVYKWPHVVGISATKFYGSLLWKCDHFESLCIKGLNTVNALSNRFFSSLSKVSSKITLYNSNGFQFPVRVRVIRESTACTYLRTFKHLRWRTFLHRILVFFVKIPLHHRDLTSRVIVLNRPLYCISFSVFPPQTIAMSGSKIVASKREHFTNPLYNDLSYIRVGDSIVVNLGKRIQIDCRASGLPVPKYIWKFNGESLSEHKYIVDLKNGSILVQRVTWNHEGQFRCFAVNSICLLYTSPSPRDS